MGMRVAANQRRKRGSRPRPKRINGTFKISQIGKYKASGRRIDGHWFASGVEADRYMQLKLLENAGRIERFEMQQRYKIVVDGVFICDYVCDFRYIVRDENGSILDQVVEDVKGFNTPVYILKKKLMKAVHRIDVVELPGQWMKHYADKHGLECLPIVKELGDVKAARRKLRLAKKRAEKKALIEQENAHE